MKESRYIELLNLYVDHQLTAAESAELEAEVQKDPARRRLFVQYCRMQKGCTALFEAERSLAPKTAAAVMALDNRVASTEVTVFPGWNFFGRRGVQIVGGSMVAAACVAFALVQWRTSSSGPALSGNAVADAASAGKVAAAPSVVQDTVSSSALSAGAPRAEFQPVFIATTSLRSGREWEMESSVAHNAGVTGGLEWLNSVSLPAVRPVQAEDLAFEPATLRQPETRVYGSRRPLRATTEMSAFQFQK